MLHWFRSQPVCPVDPVRRAWIDRRWAWLEAQFGSALSREAAVVLPTHEFFPDPYDGGTDAVRNMFDRVCGYMRIDPATVRLHLFDEVRTTDFTRPEGYSTGAAGYYGVHEGTFLIQLGAAGLDDPLALVATMAHELDHVHLLGHNRIGADAADHEPLTDLLTVFFGMGVFNANSVIREFTLTTGTAHFSSVAKLGYLSMPDYGYAVALFARARGETQPRWRKKLRLDVRVPFAESLRLPASESSNPRK